MLKCGKDGTMRQLGGAFSIAIAGAAFAATGRYYPATAFSDGAITAFAVAAGLALSGAIAAIALPGRTHGPPRPGPASAAAVSTARVGR